MRAALIFSFLITSAISGTYMASQVKYNLKESEFAIKEKIKEEDSQKKIWRSIHKITEAEIDKAKRCYDSLTALRIGHRILATLVPPIPEKRYSSATALLFFYGKGYDLLRPLQDRENNPELPRENYNPADYFDSVCGRDFNLYRPISFGNIWRQSGNIKITQNPFIPFLLTWE